MTKKKKKKRERSERARGKSSRRVSPLYFHSLASYLFLWGFLSPSPSRPFPLFYVVFSKNSRETDDEFREYSRTRARGERGRRRRARVMAFSLASCSLLPPEIPSARPGRETPCPLNGVTGLPWLPGTPWKRRHRRAQRKAHLFWKNIVRTSRAHEPHQGRYSSGHLASSPSLSLSLRTPMHRAGCRMHKRARSCTQDDAAQTLVFSRDTEMSRGKN